ncbi:nucleoside triphosphate pyrophosphohydrolase [Sphingobacterium hungaricum]|uniref:Nucleoside triphosphate pyrophosphohydrolase n=1 Tax=Sphingobacterium hungaricum TaxID=2082723 RepID=A0A928UW70_9SPHI|nr:nucleoside triphosphate pyrophosphohydrolase [Sphingobacterium hungaricum]MBE8712239.1 nucleoside triphosphate pyrophosphohydrolase [Sphingobacterium hungaricum]
MPHPIPEKGLTTTDAFQRLLDVLYVLRKECPWDKKQTMESLRPLTIEELYELSDAIIEKDTEEIKEELGDIMMHLVFYARIAEEENSFTLVDVLNTVCEKLIVRHPHIYADIEVANEDDVKKNWESIKLQQGGKSVLSGVPAGLPALVKAYRIQDKVRGVGFDWEDKKEVWKKVEEELQEFKDEFDVENSNVLDIERAENEFGDLLFSLINYARHLGINPENALEKTNKKFIHRFSHIEKRATENGQEIQNMTLEEMDVYWNEAKTLNYK